MMNLITYITMAGFLLSTVSLSESETPSAGLNTTTVMTTREWVLGHPHTDSHGVSEDDSKKSDDDGDDDDDDANEDDDGDDDDTDDDDHHLNPDNDGEKYPNPRKDPQECHLGDEPAWLCNEDKVLDVETAKELDELLESMVDAKGICPCKDEPCSYTGFPMAVVVLDTIPEYQNKSRKFLEGHVRHLARQFLDEWNFNTCDDGAVTVVLASERIVETEIGGASEYLMPDDCEEFVENETSSLFEEGLVEEGLTKMIEQYRLIVLKKHSCNSDAYLKRSIIIPIILILALIIVAAAVATVIVIYRRRGSKDIRTEANVPLKDQQHAEKA